MTIFEYGSPKKGLFYSLLTMDKKVRTNALIVVMIGVFLLPKTAYLSTISEERIIELTNLERVEAGLHPLSVNPLLTQAAKEKAAAIIETDIFEHSINGRGFSSWIKDVGYGYSIVGENLAIDFVTSEGLLKAWKGSPDHYKNLFSDRYEDIGVAVLEGEYQGQNTIIVAQIFGTPKIAVAETVAETKKLADVKGDGFLSVIGRAAERKLLSWPLLAFLSGANNMTLFALAGNEIGF